MIKINEKKELRKQLIKNIILNFIIFTLILIIFDFIIYNQVARSLYQDVDKELESSMLFEGNLNGNLKNDIDLDVNFSDEEKSDKKDDSLIDNKDDDNALGEARKENEDGVSLSPRLIIVERDENGEITNSDTLGILSNYDIKFNSSQLDTIYNIQIDGEYVYRGINYEVTRDGETVYLQVLVNVDGEAGTIENLISILGIGTLILVVVSIVVSYLLSKRAMKPIVDAYKKQTEFVQNASHELRTPLTIIQAKEELLLTEPNAKIIDKSEDINLVLKETKRLTKLIKELMDLARGDEGNIELQKELININDLILEVTEPYCDLAKMQNKVVELDLKCNKEIKINKNKISEVLIIVLDNAIKYTNESDKITVKTYFKDGKCNIEVQDTGIGISDKSISHIFDRFYREDKARSRETGGNGLGLSIAKMIVNLHGGTICALHNKPKGTIIKIKI